MDENFQSNAAATAKKELYKNLMYLLIKKFFSLRNPLKKLLMRSLIVLNGVSQLHFITAGKSREFRFDEFSSLLRPLIKERHILQLVHMRGGGWKGK